MSASPTSPSELLAGAFELDEVVGQGGMAEVWRGRHVGQDVRVAVKIMDPHSSWSREGLSTFRREVQAQAALHHPAVLRIYESGELSEATVRAFDLDVSPGNPFLVMEYGPAGTLADSELSDWRSCRAFLTTVLDALAHAHSRGLIHRDLKPHNILKFPDDQATWKLADFGLAHAADRNVGRDDRDLQDPDAGTPLYMSPEQLRGEWRQFGPWTDLYQLGCIAYELVTGAPPYSGESLLEIASGHTDEPVPEVRPDVPVPEGVTDWIRGMMRTDAASRFRRAADAAHALRQCTDDRSHSLVRPDDGDAPSTDGADPAPEFADTLGEAVPATLPAVEVGDTERWGPPRTDYESGLDESTIPDEVAVSTDPVPFDAVRDEWNKGTWIPPDVRFADVGLGLFGVREVPFVDRDDECRHIWHTLEGAVDDASPAFAVVQGPSGTGKSRLAEWMAQRSHELGACTVLRATHDRQGGPTTGLRGMLERWFDTFGLDRQAVWETVRPQIVDMARRQNLSIGRMVEDEARALTEFLRPADEQSGDPGGPSYQFASRTEKLVVVVRILQRIAEERPLFVWLDDIHWSRDTFDLVEHLAALETECPALVALTVRTDELEESEVTSDELESIEQRPDTVRIDVDRLPARHQATLVDRMLGLESNLAERVCRRTEGNPLFAIQLVGDWVSRGLLEPGDDGFRLVEDAEDEVPDEIRDLWNRRLERVFDELPGAAADTVARALELAAALGRHFDRREWAAACNAAGFTPPRELVDQELVGRGLVEREDDAWQFVHSMLVETLLEQARDHDRLTANHRICAETLRDLHADRRGAVAEREADHWLGAEEPDEAMSALLLAADWSNEHGDFEGAADALDRFDALADDHDLDADDRRRVESWTLRAYNCFRRGETDEALSSAKSAEKAARHNDWPELLGDALSVHAGIQHMASQFDRALELLKQAQTAYAQTDDGRALGDCSRKTGIIYRSTGRHELAEEEFEKAREQCASVDDPVGMLRADLEGIWNSVQKGDFAKAEKQGRRVIDDANDVGIPDVELSAWNAWGDVARLRNRPEVAQERYERAAELAAVTGSSDESPIELNLAMAQLASGDTTGAAQRFEQLIEKLSETGFLVYLPHAHLGRAAAAAANQNWTTYDRAIGEFRPAFETSEHPDPDLAWLALVGCRFARNVGASTHADELAEIGETICSQLGDTERTRQIKRKIEATRKQ